MTSSVTLKNNETVIVQRIADYYCFLFNNNLKHCLKVKLLYHAGRKLEIDDDFKADSRLYAAIPYHIHEIKKKLSNSKPFYNFRLYGVHIINGQFIFNGIVFSFPELMINNDFYRCNIKFRLHRNNLTAYIDEESLIVTNYKAIRDHYFHIWDYDIPEIKPIKIDIFK